MSRLIDAEATRIKTEILLLEGPIDKQIKVEEARAAEVKRVKLEARFIRAMEAAYAIFKEDAFRKRYDHKAKRSYINKALFESWSVNLDKLNDQHLTLLKKRHKQVKDEFINLMIDNNNPFNNAISQGTGSVVKVKVRFSEIEKLIRKVLS